MGVEGSKRKIVEGLGLTWSWHGTAIVAVAQRAGRSNTVIFCENGGPSIYYPACALCTEGYFPCGASSTRSGRGAIRVCSATTGPHVVGSEQPWDLPVFTCIDRRYDGGQG